MNPADLEPIIDLCIEARRYASIEARRYVSIAPDTARKLAIQVAESLSPLRDVADDIIGPMAKRISTNLMRGVHFIHADPQVLASYLYAAAFELRALQGQLEKQQEGTP